MDDARLALITGAAGEVGRATARRFAESGWSLALCDRDAAVGRVAAELGREFGRTALAIEADITDDREVERVVAASLETGIPLGFLGLVAAINQSAASIENLDMAVWDRVQSVNLRANVKFLSVAVPHLRRGPDPSIVLVASFWGREGHPYFSAYCASKAALISLTQGVAAELAPDIRVNCVAPGNIDTPMHYAALAVEAKTRGISEDAMRDIEWRKIPMRRPAQTAEIAAAIHFLSTPEAGYFVGATLDVNGGCRFT